MRMDKKENKKKIQNQWIVCKIRIEILGTLIILLGESQGFGCKEMTQSLMELVLVLLERGS